MAGSPNPIDTDPAPTRVLLVEDCTTDAELLALVFDDAGAPIQWQHVCSESALRGVLAGSSVDLVISDYRLPGFDGLQALAIVSELAPGVPFVFCCGEADPHFERQATDAGARACVPKHQMWKLPAVVAALLARS